MWYSFAINGYSIFLRGVIEELTRLLNLFTLSRSANTSHSSAQFGTHGCNLYSTAA